VKAKQYSVACTAIGLIAAIYVFGTTKFPTKAIALEEQKINITSLLKEARLKLPTAEKKSEEELSRTLAAARTTEDSVLACEPLMKFWGNDLKNHDIASWYLAQKAKLENSEKSLTFAANFILENTIHGDGNVLSAGWKAGLARELFRAALAKNPGNDSLTTGLGAAYLFGSGENTMEGVSMILQQLKKDSSNAYAHKMLGFGNIRNGEMAKAVSRFEKSLLANPTDTSLIPVLTLVCREAKDSVRAAKWYKRTREVLSGNPGLLKDFEAQYRSSK
jgi:cytochrome c-type biogenesis protein CcmH/NrfG